MNAQPTRQTPLMNKTAINYSKDQAVFMQQVDLQEFITQIINIIKPAANVLTTLNTLNL